MIRLLIGKTEGMDNVAAGDVLLYDASGKLLASGVKSIENYLWTLTCSYELLAKTLQQKERKDGR
jgi:hypothetical protein